MTKDVRARMAERHESYIAHLLDGYRSPGSGNHLTNQTDGRRSRHRHRLAWAKVTEQAQTDRPLMPLRFYLDDRLSQCVDLVVMRADDLAEILQLVEQRVEPLAKYPPCSHCGSTLRPGVSTCPVCGPHAHGRP